MARERQLLCPELLPSHYRGQVVGLYAGLQDQLKLHIMRLIQTGQADFISTTYHSLVCSVLLGFDGRGDDKASYWKTPS